ncbi:MAG TPA: hypothetical protein VIM79_24540, partial [Niastella sp.]
MVKRLIILVLNLVTVAGVMAQKQIRLQFTNQYETPVEHITIVSAGQTADYTTDKMGFTTITLNPSVDSITISSPQHANLTKATASLKNDTLIALHKNFTWKDLLNPMFYIVYGGLWLLVFIVFAETGLFVGFFLPGDSLLFIAGIYSSNLGNELFKSFGMSNVNYEWLNLFVLIGLVSLAGILGNTVGYWFGKK